MIDVEDIFDPSQILELEYGSLRNIEHGLSLFKNLRLLKLARGFSAYGRSIKKVSLP